MSLNNLLNQFLGAEVNAQTRQTPLQVLAIGSVVSPVRFPAGSPRCAAGGIVALLMSNKSARKYAGKVATYCGAAVLGGLAYKAFKDRKQQPATAEAPASPGRWMKIPFINASSHQSAEQPYELT